MRASRVTMLVVISIRATDILWRVGMGSVCGLDGGGGLEMGGLG